MDWLIDLLKWVIPTIIAVISITFAIMQRRSVKEEISKKRYLEEALTNLNEVIAIVEDLPSHMRVDEESDLFNDAEIVINDTLRTSLITKKKVVSLEISYIVEDWGDLNTPIEERKPYRKLSLPKEYDPDWFPNVLKDRGFSRINLSTRTETKGYTRHFSNSPSPRGFLWVLFHLLRAIDKLSKYEEVYESLAYDSLNEIKQAYEEISKTLFELIHQEKNVSKLI